MKTCNKLICGLLSVACLLSLAGCFSGNPGGGGNSGGNETYGRYVEEDITPPDMQGSIYGMFVDGQGVIDIVTSKYNEDTWKSTMYRYRSEDNGKSWQELDMSWTEPYQPDYKDFEENGWPDEVTSLGYQMAFTKDGDLITTLSTYKEKEESNTTRAIYVARDNSIRDIDLPIFTGIQEEGVQSYIQNMMVVGGGDKLLVEMYSYRMERSNSGMGMMSSSDGSEDIKAIYDLNTGEKLVDLNDYDGWNFFANESTVYIETQSGDYVAIDIETGAELPVELPSSEDFYSANIYPSSYSSMVDAEHNFYDVSSQGVKKLGPGMEEFEWVMDGLNYSYGSPVSWINGMQLNSDGSFILGVEDEDISHLYRYTWDDEAVATSDDAITVYSLYESDSVRLALSEYKKAHPEVTVTYEAVFNRYDWYERQEEGAFTVEDALRQLSVELLAGGGPDVLILDDLPMESYIDKGVLEDISDLIVGKNLIPEVIAPFGTDGATYAVPTYFSVPLLFGPRGQVEQYADFEKLIEAIEDGPDLVESEEPDWETATQEEMDEYYNKMYSPMKEEDRPVMRFDSLDEMMTTLYEINGPAIYTQSGGLDTAALRTYLESVKAISDKYNMTENLWNETATESYVIAMGSTAYSYSASLEYYSNARAKVGVAQFNNNSILVNIAATEHYSRITGEWDEEDNYTETVNPDVEKRDTVAIPAPSLAEGVYQPKGMVGICSTSANKERAKEFVSVMLDHSVQKMGPFRFDLPVNRESFDSHITYMNENSAKWYAEEGITIPKLDYDGILSQLKTPYFSNEYLMGILYDNAVPYCRGQISLDDCVKAIQSETDTYFAEKQ